MGHQGNFNAGQVNPGSYANFDSRYYTKAQTDAGYMPKTGAYTKARVTDVSSQRELYPSWTGLYQSRV